jgi:hypothetical protein
MKSDKHNDLLPRDAALARLLAEALECKPAGDAQSSACPDAETLAAYAEHGLSDREASRWEGHIADCSRCQKIIAGVVISGENLEEASNKEQGSPAPASVIRKPIPQPGAVEISRWPGFRHWWLPGLGLAAAVVLWFALHPALLHQASPQRAAATTGTSQGSAQGNPSASYTKPEETQMAQAQVPQPPEGISGAAGISGGTIRDSEEPPANSTADALKKSAQQGSLQSEGQSEAQNARQTPPVSPAISEAPRAAAPPVPEAKEKDSGAASAQTTDKKTQTIDALAAPAAGAPAAAAPAAPAAEPAPKAGPTQDLARQLDISAGFSSTNQVRALAKIVTSPIEFASPNRSVLWRVGQAGLIENSSDQGQTWRPQASGVIADLLAGAAPSAKIAWAAGRGGIILRTEDGEHWQRVMPPSFVNAAGAQNVAPPDWISIEARDELHATIVSRDLHRYATADGGRTWVQQ